MRASMRAAVALALCLGLSTPLVARASGETATDAPDQVVTEAAAQEGVLDQEAPSDQEEEITSDSPEQETGETSSQDAGSQDAGDQDADDRGAGDQDAGDRGADDRGADDQDAVNQAPEGQDQDDQSGEGQAPEDQGRQGAVDDSQTETPKTQEAVDDGQTETQDTIGDDETDADDEKVSELAVAADPIDGFLSISLQKGEDSQTVPFTAPLTGFYTFQVTEQGTGVTIYVRDVTEGVELGSFELCRSDEASEPIVYLEALREYEFTFKKWYYDKVTAALSLTCTTTQVDDCFTIEDGVLTGYTGEMVTIRIPEGVTSISSEAYEAMADSLDPYYEGNAVARVMLGSLYLPASLTEISAKKLNLHDMSNFCLNANGFLVADDSASFSAREGVLYNKDGSKLIAVPICMKGSLTVPDGVTTIGTFAFAYGGITKVVFPDTLVTVEESAFRNASISEIDLPDSVKTIEMYAFAYIGWSGSSSLKKITLGNGVETIGFAAFEKMRDDTLTLPASVKSVDTYAFESCPNLTEVTILGDTELDDRVFAGCPKLETLVISGNASFDGSCFEKCPSLTNFEVGSGATDWQVSGGCLITKVYDYYVTGEGYRDILCLVLAPASTEAIDFVVPNAVDRVWSYAMTNVADINKLTVGKKCRDLGSAVYYNLSSISVVSGNPLYFVRDGVLYCKHFTGNDYKPYSDTDFDLERFPMKSSKTSFVVPDDVVYIGYEAFTNFSEDTPRTLKKVTIPRDTSLYYGGDVFSTKCSEGEITLTIASYEDSDAEDYYNSHANQDHLAWKQLYYTYTIVFNANGGKIGTETTKTITVKEGDPIGALPTPTRSGYTFQGWYDAKTDGDKITADDEFYWDDTLYAYWKKKTTTRTVTFDGNGGTPSEKTRKVDSGSKIGKLPTATRKGYMLQGWYTAKSGGTKVTTTTVIDKNQTLYARWLSANIAKVTVKVTGTYTWDGLPQKATVKVTYGGVTLKKDTDYTVSYSNIVEPGSKAKVIVKGKGIFAATNNTQTVNFTIEKATPTIGVEKGTHQNGTFKKSRAYCKSDAKQQDYLIYEANQKGKTISIKPLVKLPNEEFKDDKKDKVKLTFTSARKQTAEVTKNTTATTAEIKLIKPEETEITVKMAATTHYKAKTYTFRVALKANKSEQVIKLTSNRLGKDANGGLTLGGSYQQVSLGVSVKGQAAYTCSVKNIDACAATSNGGDRITAPYAGKIEVKVSTKATNVYPANAKTFAITITGFKALVDATGDWRYTQDSDGNIIILKYLGSSVNVRVPLFKVGFSLKSASEVAERAFENNTTMASISFGAGKSMNDYGSLKRIGTAAFKNCTALRTVILPKNVTYLGGEAFLGCKGLTSIVLPEGVTKLGKAAFKGCSNITGVLDLPAGMTSIGAEAFSGCGRIEELHVHKSLTTIGNDAFSGCSALRKLYYEKGQASWNAVSKGSGNGALTGSATTRFFNCGKGAARASMSDSTLFASNPRALVNKGFDEIDDRLLANSLSVVSNVSFGQYAASYVKTATADVVDWPLRNFTEWALGGTWSEDALTKQIALELLESDMRDVDNIDIHKDYSNEFKDKYDQVYSYLKTVSGWGKLIYVNDNNRYQVAREINRIYGGSLEDMSRINNGLKKIGDSWDSTAGAYLAKTGKDLDAVDFLLSYLEIVEVGYERVYELKEIVPPDSQLYNGLAQIEAGLTHPFSDYAVHYLLDEALSLETKILELTIARAAVHTGSRLSPVTYVAIASYFYKAISISMGDTPAMSDHYRAWFAINNAMTLRNISDGYRADIIAAGGTSDEALIRKFKISRRYYYAALKQAVPYTITVAKGTNSAAADYLKVEYDKYQDALNLSNYLNSCKANAQGL